MAEAKKKPRKAAGEAANLVTVDVNRLREALKHTFEGVTMLFDCIGLNVPVGDPVREEEEKPKENSSAVEPEFTPVEEPPEEVINQIARRVNSTGRLYAGELSETKQELAQTENMMREIYERLSEINI